MHTTIRVARYIGKGFPDEEGKQLARALIKDKNAIDWTDFTCDLRCVKPRMIISGFFNSFWQTFHDEAPELFKLSKAIMWSTDFEFQANLINKFVSRFRPRNKSNANL